MTSNEAQAEYEASDRFVEEAVDALASGSDPLPDDLVAALTDWYRGQPLYRGSVQSIRDKAARPY